MKTIEEAYPAWSKSGLSSIVDGCSWQSFLSKVLGLADPGTPATLAGTAYHAALELHERARILNLRGADVQLPDLGELQEVAGRVVEEGAGEIPDEQWHLHGSEPALVADSAMVALNHWWHTPYDGDGESLRDRLMGMRPVLAEPYFRTPTDWSARPLHGYIDWAGYDHATGEWVIVDHKSARSYGRWPRDGAGHEVEAAAYTVGALRAAGIPVSGPVRMEWHVTRTSEGQNARFEGARLVTRKVDQYDEMLLSDHVKIADRTVDEGLFQTNPGWNLCSQRWCPFWRGCQVTGELSPETVHAAQQLVS